ncbi:MAG: DnaJ family domain-containing protein [Actinomycetota bacterium]
MTLPVDPVEDQIRQAIERGDFNNLGGEGRPLSTHDIGPGWWARQYLDRWRASERAEEQAHRVDQELGAVWLLPDEPAVRRRVAELNDSLGEANEDLAPDEQVELLKADEVVAIWRKMGRARRQALQPTVNL